MGIKIPQSFLNIIEKDDTYSNLVKAVRNNAEKYLKPERPEFFSEYTQHGVDHVNKVLELAEQLIHVNSFKQFTPCAMAVLVLSIMLHDIGMFVEKAGVKKMLFSDSGNDAMKKEWMKYFEEARYYGKYKKKRVLGYDDEIEDIPDETKNWNEKHIKIIGEFLRKHHHELSRDIIIGKFPGETDHDIFENTAFAIDSPNPANDRDNIRFLVGKIAESHCITIRETVKSLSNMFGATTVHKGLVISNKVPAFFIMTVLRLADLLDAGEHRASILIKDVIGITALNSQEEFDWNQRITIESTGFDKKQELLYVDANPTSGTESIKITEWIKRIQYELDTSWAIISQYYDINKYALTIHIVNCSVLDDDYIESMNKKFVTERANFKASPNLLPMLINPLYGDNPTYGVRELVQNAVDACNERTQIKNLPAKEARIDVSVNTIDKTFTIKDNGIGMTKDVILNHYLAIGYSYRISPHYLQNFVENGKPKIARNGRFGIGDLAIFLLGTSATIKTRNYNEELGYEFTVRFSPLDVELQQENIEINRINCEIGTEITVEISDEAVEFFKNSFIYADIYDFANSTIHWTKWYNFSSPVITYNVDDEDLPKIVDIFELEHDGNPVIWNRFDSKVFDEYCWTFSLFKDAVDKPLFCNGIAIPSTETWLVSGFLNGLPVDLPIISLRDPFNRLNLNLSRNYCQEIPDSVNLLREVYRYIIAKLLVSDFSSQSEIDANIRYGFDYRNEKNYGVKKTSHYLKSAAFLIKDNSYSLLSEPFLVYLKPLRIAIFCSGDLDENLDKLVCPNCRSYSFYTANNNNLHDYYHVYEDRLPFSFDLYNLTQEEDFFLYYESRLSLRNFFINKKFFDAEIKDIFFDEKQERLKETILNSEVYCDTYQANFNPKYKPKKQYKLPDSIVSVYDFSIDVKPDNPNYLMLQQIRDYLITDSKDIWLPFDMEERIKKFPTAFIKLSEKFPEVFNNLPDEYKKAIEELKNEI